MEDEKYKDLGEKMPITHMEGEARDGIATLIRREIISRYSFILRKFENCEEIKTSDRVNIRQIKILLNFLAQLGV